ncbi:MAG: DUF2868 domain-containing protein [Deltaproteobacteria bacterium]|nr:DUF2868 domain-containing protein [Candidatus Desulfobacula maris]
MKLRLKDIIDLDYFISMDDALDSPEEIQEQLVRDRKIYNQCRSTAQTEKNLLLKWLAFRKDEFFKKKDKKGLTLLPGTIFSTLYSWMIYAMALTGGVTGVSLAYSFLAYHGNRPINVSIFIVLFILFQVLLILLTLILLVRKAIGTKRSENFFHNSIIHTLISSLFFNVLPKIIKKTGQTIFKKSLDTLEYTSLLIRVKNREYKDLFFWPIFIMTSVFAVSFSTGALGGTFFRVIVSDMAFGWQSTLTASSDRVYDLVSFIALPWSWFVPEFLAHPSLEQIEGSRIILKDGISVLATQDLVSWWPFICMGILFYAVIPRGFLIIIGILAQKHVLHHFNFKRPRFKLLIVRMQSPVLDYNADKTQASQVSEENLNNNIKENSSFKTRQDVPGQKALLLLSKNVYSDEIIKSVIKGIETHLFFNVKEALGISFDFNDDADIIRQKSQEDVDHVILVHEVWQPPIRGLLHYIKQIKALMPQGRLLWILLTQDAGQADLSVDNTDINYDVWKKAVFKLENPDIVVKRFI